MIGAIAGDMIGNVYEFNPIKTTDFPLWHPSSTFTDDTVLTIALADTLLHGIPYAVTMLDYVKRYPDRGYGGFFARMIRQGSVHPYNSFGNGSAMRISPVGYAFDTEADVLAKAKEFSEITHNHPEGIKGGQATALAIFLARKGASKDDIRTEISKRFAYDLDQTVEQIRPTYRFDETCQGSVPQAIIAFLDADSYETSLRLAVSLGGDADTQACIAGAIAAAFFGVPEDIQAETYHRLPEELRSIVQEFETRYPHTSK